MLRQRQAERKGQQKHGPTIENPRVDVFNLFAEHEWEGEQDRDGYRHRVTRIGAQLGAEQLGASLYELPPGEGTFPYHYELGPEEWLLVVSGRPTLRTPDGERQLAPGDVAVFPQGPAGGHKVTNATEETVRVVIFSSKTPARRRRVPGQQQGRHLDEGAGLPRAPPRRAEAGLLGRRVTG